MVCEFFERQHIDLRNIGQYQAAIIPQDPPIERPAKITKINGTVTESHLIRYSDIDFNQHTNSMKYVQWMVDMLPLKEFTDQRLCLLDINFLHETRYGQLVQIVMENDDNFDKFEIKLADTGVAACKATLRWM